MSFLVLGKKKNGKRNQQLDLKTNERGRQCNTSLPFSDLPLGILATDEQLVNW